MTCTVQHLSPTGGVGTVRVIGLCVPGSLLHTGLNKPDQSVHYEEGGSDERRNAGRINNLVKFRQEAEEQSKEADLVSKAPLRWVNT